VRHLLARELERLLADELRDLELRREVGALLGRVVGRAIRQERDEVVAELADTVAGERADGVERVEIAEAGGVLHLPGDVPRLQAVDLVQRDHDGHAETEDALGDEAVARADPLACREDEEHRLDVLERLVDGALHPLGERVARALETREVGEHELEAVAVDDPGDPPARRLRLVGDDRNLPARERVHERRLTNVRPPRDGDEPASQAPTPPPRVGMNARRPRR
jgi:hypothetical protein